MKQMKIIIKIIKNIKAVMPCIYLMAALFGSEFISSSSNEKVQWDEEKNNELFQYVGQNRGENGRVNWLNWKKAFCTAKQAQTRYDRITREKILDREKIKWDEEKDRMITEYAAQNKLSNGKVDWRSFKASFCPFEQASKRFFYLCKVGKEGKIVRKNKNDKLDEEIRNYVILNEDENGRINWRNWENDSYTSQQVKRRYAHIKEKENIKSIIKNNRWTKRQKDYVRSFAYTHKNPMGKINWKDLDESQSGHSKLKTEFYYRNCLDGEKILWGRTKDNMVLQYAINYSSVFDQWPHKFCTSKEAEERFNIIRKTYHGGKIMHYKEARWSQDEDQELVDLVKQNGRKWTIIAHLLREGKYTSTQCRQHYDDCLNSKKIN